MRSVPRYDLVADIGARVRLLRGLVGWSQDRLARYAHTSQGAVSRLECGSHHATLATAAAIAGAFARVRRDLDGTVTPPVSRFLCAVDEMLTSPCEDTPPPTIDPEWRSIVRAYHALTERQRGAFREIARAALQVLGNGRAA